MSGTSISPCCIATVVTEAAISAMLESGGRGSYKDNHPWLVARDLLAASEDPMAILFASLAEDGTTRFSHWSTIEGIDVVELHRGEWESRVRFGRLLEVNPIWDAVDSVFLKPSSEQLARESLEGIRVSRQSLDEHHIHPYAICETPAFVSASV